MELPKELPREMELENQETTSSKSLTLRHDYESTDVASQTPLHALQQIKDENIQSPIKADPRTEN